jgi:glycogen operon protein
MLATLMLSFGVPLLLGGDEMGRTQGGNNNAYCQDNEITWFDWDGPDTALLAFTKNLIAFRRAHPVFRRRRFLAGAEASQLQWFTPAGTPMDSADWADPDARAIAIYLDGSDDPDLAEDGTPLVDDDFLVLVNSWWEPLGFTLPATRPRAQWHIEIDTYDPAAPRGTATAAADGDGDGSITVGPRSVVVLKNPRPVAPPPEDYRLAAGRAARPQYLHPGDAGRRQRNHHDIKALRPYEATEGRGEPWPRHPAPVG